MSARTVAIAVFLVACIAVPAALGQAEARDTNNELSGIIGRTFISDQGIKGAPSFDPVLRFGNGLSFEVNYTRLLKVGSLTSLSLEIPALFNPDEDLHAALPNRIPAQYASYFVTPSVRANIFTGQAVSPWISFGGGFGHFAEHSTLLFGGKNTGPTGTNTGVFQAGVGLDVRIVGAFNLRGEARDFYSGVPQLGVDTGKSRQHNFFVGAGVVWHF